ncbi:hypothetical protein BDV33DRAFT_210318 [Aspergillus novoparasiticus]|uniref:Uncharacterized protein n=1 Tax=Aspergillus novoparasiticus TaxID=986946 RepID=A0A5N6E7R0_9EURO|nr:hypothetical protein BDV33DRAFT_210318 [Aspergillus novoparasiticus]
MGTGLHFVRLGVLVTLALDVVWCLPTPITESNAPESGSNDLTEFSGGMITGLPSQEGPLSFTSPAEGQSLYGPYHSISDYEQVANDKTVTIQRRQSDDGFVSAGPTGDSSTAVDSDQSSSSSPFSFNTFGNYLVGENGELSEFAKNAANNIANNPNMDDRGETPSIDPKMSSPINQNDPGGTTPPKEAQNPLEHSQPNYDRERELQAYRVQHPDNFFDGWNAHMAQSGAGPPSTAGRVGNGAFYREAGKRLSNWVSDMWGRMNNFVSNA